MDKEITIINDDIVVTFTIEEATELFNYLIDNNITVIEK